LSICYNVLFFAYEFSDSIKSISPFVDVALVVAAKAYAGAEIDEFVYLELLI